MPKVIHGYFGTPEYNSWCKMISRCRNKKTPNYKLYGARGIKVCERWRRFENFISDMGDKPFAGAQIDRIDNDGDYTPSNCRWATRRQNTNNRRKTIFVIYKGEKRALGDWAHLLGIPYDRTFDRIKKMGWSAERAFTESPQKKNILYKIGNEELTIAQWAKKIGIKKATIRKRIETGVPIERIFYKKHCGHGTTRYGSLLGECKKLGISYVAVKSRIRRGWTRDDALSIPISTPAAPQQPPFRRNRP